LSAGALSASHGSARQQREQTVNPAELADDVIGLVKRRGPGAEALVSVERGRSGHTRFACNEITTAADVDTSRVRVTFARGKRHGTATQTATDPRALSDLVDRAAAIASIVPDDPEWMGVLGSQDQHRSSDTFDESTLAASVDVRASAVKSAIAVAESNGATGAGSFSARSSVLALATTAGLRAVHRATVARLTMTARSSDGTGSGWAGAEGVSAASIDPVLVAQAATEKALLSRRPRRAEPGNFAVVLDPACVGDLLRFLFEVFDQRSADEGRSFFAKREGGSRIGERLFAPGLTLRGDPFDEMTPGAPFDGEGLPVEPTTYVNDGTLQEMVTSRYWAHRTGTKASAFPSAIHWLPGKAGSIDELISTVHRGLYVSRFWYMRWLDPHTTSMTGMTRDGVFLIEDGELLHAVNNFRFNQSLAHVLRNATSWTESTLRIPSSNGAVRAPAVLSEDFRMTSASTAI
jgi:predicted Zn-dependent protease